MLALLEPQHWCCWSQGTEAIINTTWSCLPSQSNYSSSLLPKWLRSTGHISPGKDCFASPFLDITRWSNLTSGTLVFRFLHRIRDYAKSLSCCSCMHLIPNKVHADNCVCKDSKMLIQFQKSCFFTAVLAKRNQPKICNSDKLYFSFPWYPEANKKSSSLTHIFPTHTTH